MPTTTPCALVNALGPKSLASSEFAELWERVRSLAAAVRTALPERSAGPVAVVYDRLSAGYEVRALVAALGCAVAGVESVSVPTGSLADPEERDDLKAVHGFSTALACSLGASVAAEASGAFDYVLSVPDDCPLRSPEPLICSESPLRATALPADFLDALARCESVADLARTVARAPEDGEYPLSAAQEAAWVSHVLDPRAPYHNVHEVLEVDGEADWARLVSCLAVVARRYAAFRTRLRDCGAGGGGDPVQAVGGRPWADVQVVDLSTLDASSGLAMVREFVLRPFDVEGGGPLLRAALVRSSPTSHVLALAGHRLCVDAHSLAALLAQAQQLYAGASVDWDAYGAFAEWARDESRARKSQADAAVDRWRAELSRCQATLDLPTDRPHPAEPSASSATHSVRVPVHTVSLLAAAAARYRTDARALLAACFAEVLHRYARQEDIVVAVDPRAASAGQRVGSASAPSLLRAQFAGASGAKTVADLVAAVAQRLEAAATHWCPVHRLGRVLGRSAAGRQPLVQAAFSFVARRAVEFGATTARRVYVEPGACEHELEALVDWLEDSVPCVFLRLRYRTDLWDEPFVRTLAACFVRLLRDLAEAAPDTPLWRLRLVPEEHEAMLLRELCRPVAGVPDELAHERFEALARESPDAVAVVHGDASITRGELSRRSTNLARRLAAWGVARGSTVCTMFRRSIDYFVAALAVVKAGAAYAPIDPKSPPARVSFFVAFSGSAVVLCEAGLAESVEQSGVRARVVVLGPDAVAAAPEGAPELPRCSASDAMYLMFTSGTSGFKPNGIVVEHRSAVNLLQALEERDRLGPSERTVLACGESWDTSVSELWPPLRTGAVCHVMDDAVKNDDAALFAWLERSGITVADLPVSVVERVLRDRAPRGLRVVRTGGEKLHYGVSVPVWNEYGPTETTVYSTEWLVAPHARDPPIGRPVRNCTALVVDAHMRPVPVGVPGELLIGGACVARGYVNKPEYTAEKFVQHEALGRVFRTGDLCRLNADGSIAFVSRMSQQLRVDGARVDVGRVECALCDHAGVRQAAVAFRCTQCRPDLVAFVVPAAPGARAADLDAYARRRLVPGMAPSAYVFVDRLPLNKNDKVDFSALEMPAPTGEQASWGGASSPSKREQAQTEDEAAVMSVVQRVLSLPAPVAATERLFGGAASALDAPKLARALAKYFGVDVAPRDLILSATVRSVAELVAQARGRPAEHRPASSSASGGGGSNRSARPAGDWCWIDGVSLLLRTRGSSGYTATSGASAAAASRSSCPAAFVTAVNVS
eukprot:m51a1_g8409 putative arthrofactin synthetase syringopeptin synthetase c-related non-ribosomal peptide synthetase (1284) ;mRNA; r:264669-269165